MRSISVGSGLDGLHLDSADTTTVLNTDLDVTSISPGRAPRVLDEVVRGTVLSSIADSEDTMVKLLSACIASEDTRLVHLEGFLVGLNSNRDGSLSKGSLELVGVVGGDTGLAQNLDISSLNGGVASSNLSLAGGVGVVGLEDSSVSLVEHEGE